MAIPVGLLRRIEPNVWEWIDGSPAPEIFDETQMAGASSGSIKPAWAHDSLSALIGKAQELHLRRLNGKLPWAE